MNLYLRSNWNRFSKEVYHFHIESFGTFLDWVYGWSRSCTPCKRLGTIKSTRLERFTKKTREEPRDFGSKMKSGGTSGIWSKFWKHSKESEFSRFLMQTTLVGRNKLSIGESSCSMKMIIGMVGSRRCSARRAWMIGRALKDHFLSVWIDGPLWMSQSEIFTSQQIGQIPRPLEKGEWSGVKWNGNFDSNPSRTLRYCGEFIRISDDSD
jgi:hypothetical protein